MQWADYVAQRSEGRDQTRLADFTGVSQSTISRWKTSKGRPSAVNAMDFARAVGDSPVTGLLAAGLITEKEVGKVVRVVAGLSDATAADLLVELARRLDVDLTARGVRGA